MTHDPGEKMYVYEWFKSYLRKVYFQHAWIIKINNLMYVVYPVILAPSTEAIQ